MRGEHDFYATSCPGDRGSSPRARGARDDRPAQEIHHGIIPACAGSTPARWHRPLRCRGSSPRARGARYGKTSLILGLGIIPACAGSTGRPRARLSAPRDHPRVRGEHAVGRQEDRQSAGSSPRARGAHLAVVVDGDGAGIIPACAGSTPPQPSGPAGCGDHPRVRGEHARAALSPNTTPGSSPRARGAPRRQVRPEPRAGIIPACAGSTFSTAALPGHSRDHPRVRGEHVAESAVCEPLKGSSPRARGAPRAVGG